VAVERRPDKGLLGGMLGLLTSSWGEAADVTDPIAGSWREAGSIDHVFTHFSLTLTVRVAAVDRVDGVTWLAPEEAVATLPTVFRKALERGLA